MFEEEILHSINIGKTLHVIKFVYDEVNSIHQSKIINNTNRTWENCLEAMKMANDKLDELRRITGEAMFGKLKSANLSLQDFLSSNALTESNVQMLKGIYVSTTGLPLDKETHPYHNNDIVSYSYLGLIQLENCTTKNATLIFRYIMRMFYANCIIAKEYFPEVYDEYFKNSVTMYNDLEFQFICTHKSYAEGFHRKNEVLKDIGDIIVFYNLGIEIDDWTEGSDNVKDKLFGQMLNAVIGSVNLSPTNCRQIFSFIGSISQKKNYFSEAILSMLIKLVCLAANSKFDETKYKEKREIKVVRLLSQRYLECTSQVCADTMIFPKL